MAVDTHRALFDVCLPRETMGAHGLPVLEQHEVAGAAHLRRVVVLRRRTARIDFHDAVIAVAVAAARRIDQAGQQQRAAVLARQVPVDQFGRIVVARTALLDLIDRRYRGRQIRGLMDIVRRPMAVHAGGLVAMNAAADRPTDAAVTIATALLVGQRLEIVTIMFCGHIGVAIGANEIGMSARSEVDVCMAVAAIDILCEGRRKAQ